MPVVPGSEPSTSGSLRTDLGGVEGEAFLLGSVAQSLDILWLAGVCFCLLLSCPAVRAWSSAAVMESLGSSSSASSSNLRHRASALGNTTRFALLDYEGLLIFCYCHPLAPRRISWSSRNPGCGFYSCPNWRNTRFQCDFFCWHNEDCPHWTKDRLNEVRATQKTLERELNEICGFLFNDQSEPPTAPSVVVQQSGLNTEAQRQLQSDNWKLQCVLAVSVLLNVFVLN